MDVGELYVRMAGICQTRQLFVECWDSLGLGQLAVALIIQGAVIRFG